MAPRSLAFTFRSASKKSEVTFAVRQSRCFTGVASTKLQAETLNFSEAMPHQIRSKPHSACSWIQSEQSLRIMGRTTVDNLKSSFESNESLSEESSRGAVISTKSVCRITQRGSGLPRHFFYISSA